MTRYFVDTNVLIGLTFSHDRWAIEAERILNGQNTLFTSEFVIYEYCSRQQGSPRIVPDPAQLRVEPDDESGVFGTVLEEFQENVENNIPMYNREIDLQRYDGLTFERILAIFFDNIDEEHIGIHEYWIPPVDSQWLLDAIGLAERGVLQNVVTGDKKDIVHHQQQLTSLFDISILYLLDEFHTDSRVGQGSGEVF